MDDKEMETARPRYRWPWFVLAAVVLGTVLAFVWMSIVVQRIREQRVAYPPSAPVGAGTNLVK